MPYVSIAASDVDSKSPVTDALMGLIKSNLDNLDSRITAFGLGGPYDWRYNGRLDLLPTSPAPASQGVPAKAAIRIDDVFIARTGTYTDVDIFLAYPGTGGTLDVDVRKYRQVTVPILSVSRLFDDTITSISEITATSTQSITRATGQVSTQSITNFKGTINISSIVFTSRTNEMRVNLAASIDAEAVVGDSYVIAGASTGANNGTFTILRIGDDGLNNVILSNASAVNQSTATGTAQLAAFQYNLTGSANANFVAGETAIFASHTSSANNGSFTIYATNVAGNNIVVKNSVGATQGGAVGTIDCGRLSYNFSGSAGTEFVAGESVVCASHTSGNNNGTFIIRAVNSGGNNLVLSASVITLQGGAVGNVKSLRKLANLNLDPTGLIAVGETIVIAGTVSFDGTYAAKEIKRGGTNNVVFYNATAGTDGAVGTFNSGRVKLVFSADQSASITTASNIEISGCSSGGTDGQSGNNGIFPVKAVNFGGGGNFNAVIDNASNTVQSSPQGRVDVESKSLFTVRPTISYSINGKVLQSSNNGTLGSQAACVDGDILGVEVVSIPSGQPSGFVVRIK